MISAHLDDVAFWWFVECDEYDFDLSPIGSMQILHVSRNHRKQQSKVLVWNGSRIVTAYLPDRCVVYKTKLSER